MWLKFQGILNHLEVLYEFENLAVWAKRKRLKAVQRSYQRRVEVLEIELISYRLGYPKLFALAEWILCFKRQLVSTQKYKKGYASKYSLKGMSA